MLIFIKIVIIVTLGFEIINSGRIIVFRIKPRIYIVHVITKLVTSLDVLENELGVFLYPAIVCRFFPNLSRISFRKVRP